jgi:hypothetical protein
MPVCLFLRNEKWMEENFGKSVIGCSYSAGHCKYWKNCAVEYSVDWFLSPHLNGLFQLSRDDSLAMRERVRMQRQAEEKRKLMRKQTRKYTFRRRNAKAK